MKRLAFLISMIALLAGCAKIEEIDQPIEDQPQTEIETPDTGLPEVIYASVTDEEEDPNTRTYVDNDGKTVLWHSGDAISYFTSNQHGEYVFEGEDGAKKAGFTRKSSTDITLAYGSYGIYPYSADNQLGAGRFIVTFPSTQTYAVNSFGKGANKMLATSNESNDDDLYFLNACGYLVIKLYGEGTKVKSVKLSALDNVGIAGEAHMFIKDSVIPSVTMTENSTNEVTLDCSNGGQGVTLGADAKNATEFWFALPPTTMTGGIKITVTDINDKYFVKETTKQVTVTRNIIQPMAALKFENNYVPDEYIITYTRASNQPFTFSNPDYYFGADINKHYFDKESARFVIEFHKPPTKINGFINTDIETITLPKTITSIYSSTFENSSLTSITIPGSVTLIGDSAFNSCFNLTSVTFLPNQNNEKLILEGIRNSSDSGYGGEQVGPFYDCPLTYLNLNREIEYLDWEGNPFDVTEADDGVFSCRHTDRSSMTVILGDQVRTILKYMFPEAPFTQIVIPSSVTAIEDCAFYDCDKLTSITIPGNVNSIGVDAFYNCYALSSVSILQGDQPLNLGYSYTGSNERGPFYDSPLTSVTLNREVALNKGKNDDGTFIAFVPDEEDEGLFSINSSYKSSISTNVTITQNNSIGHYMFGDLPIKSITIPSSVTRIEEGAFRGTLLNSITIPGNVNFIGTDAFYDCTSLSSITFEPSTTNTALSITRAIDPDGTSDLAPFYYSPLQTINLNRELHYININGSNFTPDYWDEGIFVHKHYNTIQSTSVSLGSQVKTISAYMFNYLPIQGITIPSSISTIEQYAFDGCSKLSSVIIEESTESLSIKGHGDSYGPFYDSPLKTISLKRPVSYKYTNGSTHSPDSDSEGLFAINSSFKSQGFTTSVTIGSNVTSIQSRMFCNLPVGSLVFHGGINSIGNDAFNGCTKLTSLTFEPSPNGTSLTLGYNTDGEEEGPFLDSPLANVNLNREINYTLASIDLDYADEGIFSQKPNLTSITLGSQVKTLSDFMFAESGLTSITIPGSVTSIGSDAFHGCTALTSLTFEAGTADLRIGPSTESSKNYGPFYDSKNLKTLNLNRNLIPNYDIKYDRHGLFSEIASLTSITLGDNVKTIHNRMFLEAGITSITIPTNVTEICDYAFYDCENLQTMTFVSSDAPTLGYKVFNGCHDDFIARVPSLQNYITKWGYDYYDDGDGILKEY